MVLWITSRSGPSCVNNVLQMLEGPSRACMEGASDKDIQSICQTDVLKTQLSFKTGNGFMLHSKK